MATAKKIKSTHQVSYMITGEQKYLIMTNNVEIVDVFKAMGIPMTFENHSYHVTIDELPMSPKLEFKKYQVKPITDAVRDEFTRELQKYEDMLASIEAMTETVSLQEELLTKLAKKKGLHLKPHLPEDSELFSPTLKKRLHIKQSLNTNIDIEAVQTLSEANPQLKKCFRTKKTIVFDRDKFKKIQKTLSAAVINKIVSYDEMESFTVLDLPEGQCKHCGGNLKKSGICKHCGIQGEVIQEGTK